jgi:hypothetical protein
MQIAVTKAAAPHFVPSCTAEKNVHPPKDSPANGTSSTITELMSGS